jgi:hypothetical protein
MNTVSFFPWRCNRLQVFAIHSSTHSFFNTWCNRLHFRPFNRKENKMNYTGISNWRVNAVEIFESLRFKAVLANLCAKILGKNTKLKGFAEQAFRITTMRISLGERDFRINSMRVYLGEQDIPVDRINGSVGRENDFDNSFRPLKKHLRDRWIAVYESFEADRFTPIQLYKIGNDYYVEDGHHRVSVARTLGRLSLRAEVWEIPLQAKKADCSFCLPAPEKRGQMTAQPWFTKGEVL